MSFFIISLTFVNPSPVKANPETLAVSTPDISLGPVSFRLSYSIDGSLDYPNTAIKGSNTHWKVSLNNGRAIIHVKVLDRDYSASVDLPLGKRKEVTLTPGLVAYIYTTISMDIQISGKGEADTSGLYFGSEGTQSFNVMISDNANVGDRISVSLFPKLDVRVGLQINLIILKQDIQETSLGPFDLNPPLEGEIRVVEQGAQQGLLSIPFLASGLQSMIIFLGLSFIIPATILSFVVKRKNPNIRPLTGVIAIVGGVICLISLWFPWIRIFNNEITGINLGIFFYEIINISILQFLIYLLLILIFLIILGGYLQIAGNDYGKSLISSSSKLLLAFSVTIIIVLSSLYSIVLEIYPMLMIIGAILAIISLRL